MHKFGYLMPLALAACAPGPSERLAINQVAGVCDDRALGTFVGQLPDQATALKLMGFSRARTLRWVPPGGMVTMDYSPQRLTVQLDASALAASPIDASTEASAPPSLPPSAAPASILVPESSGPASIADVAPGTQNGVGDFASEHAPGTGGGPASKLGVGGAALLLHALTKALSKPEAAT
jgi:hypothetical protein